VLYVGNLPFDAKKEDLAKILQATNSDIQWIKMIEIERGAHKGLGRGFGFVQFNSKKALDRAMKCHGKELGNRRILVKPANANKNPFLLKKKGIKTKRKLEGEARRNKAQTIEKEKGKIAKETRKRSRSRNRNKQGAPPSAPKEDTKPKRKRTRSRRRSSAPNGADAKKGATSTGDGSKEALKSNSVSEETPSRRKRTRKRRKSDTNEDKGKANPNKQSNEASEGTTPKGGTKRKRQRRRRRKE